MINRRTLPIHLWN